MPRRGRAVASGALKPVQQASKDDDIDVDEEKPVKEEAVSDAEEATNTRRGRPKRAAANKSGQKSSEQQDNATKPARGRKRKELVKEEEENSESDAEADTKPPPVKRPTRKAKSGAGATACKSSVDDDMDDEEEEEKKGKKTRPKSTTVELKDDHYKSGKRSVKVKGKAAVDAECTAKVDTAHVFEENRCVYDVMLNQTNIGNNNNKYYLMQLLEDDNAKVYTTWFRWGRVGFKGQTSLETFGSNLEAAKHAFARKFYDKTRNEWADHDDFEPVAGKYTLIKIDYGLAKAEEEDEAEAEAIASGDEEIQESRLDEAVQHLMSLICDIRNMEHTIHEMEYDSTKAPLGKLAPGQIRSGFAVLKEIEELLRAKKLGAPLVDATNRFYTIIPHAWGMKTPPLINNEEKLKKESELLELLEDIEFAVHSFKRKKGDKRALIDQHYDKMQCDVRALEKTSDEYTLIEKYLKSTHGSTHYTKINLHAVYAIDRKSESEKFKGHLGNVRLLWHGSRMANWFSILTQGLRIAPPEAPCTGYMFGKGVYFADCVSKSANYCYPQPGGKGILVLAEVALGKSETMRHSNYDASKTKDDSVLAEGRWVPSSYKKENVVGGIEVPMGNLKERKEYKQSPHDFSLLYNEYIVYNVDQIRLRYLLEVDF